MPQTCTVNPLYMPLFHSIKALLVFPFGETSAAAWRKRRATTEGSNGRNSLGDMPSWGWLLNRLRVYSTTD